MTEYSSDERHMEALECLCTSPAHVITVDLDLSGREELEDPTLTIAVQLSPYQPWYRRVYLSIGYIFGRRDTMWGGQWDVCMLDKNSATKLQSMIHAFQIVQKLRAHQRKLKGVKNYV